MQVRNNSARLHTVGETLIVPGTTVELGEEWRASLAGHAELEIVEESQHVAKRGRPAKQAEEGDE